MLDQHTDNSEFSEHAVSERDELCTEQNWIANEYCPQINSFL